MMSGVEGGTRGPMIQLAAVIPPAKPSSKPASFMLLISSWPRPPASARALPDMPEKIREASTFTCARPPFLCPIMDAAKSKIRVVTPPPFMRLPARTKNGTASRVWLLTPLNICSRANGTRLKLPVTAKKKIDTMMRL